MQYKQITSYILTFTVLFPLWASAIDPTSSARILDNFKKQEEEILFNQLPFGESDTTKLLEHEYALGGLEALKDRLKQVETTYTTKRDLLTEKRTSLEEAISSIDSAILNTIAEIDKTKTSIEERKVKIADYQETSIAMKDKINKNRAIILSYLANIYSEGNMIYDDRTNTVDAFQSMILSDASTDQIAVDITYKSLISILGQNFIVEYRELVREYSRILMQLQTEVDALKEDQSLFERQKSNLDSQREQRQTILDVTKGQEALFQKYIDSQRQAQESVEKSWQAASDAYNASLDEILDKNGCSATEKTTALSVKCADILTYYNNERMLKKTTSATGANIFDWPLLPKRISTFFRDPEYYRSLGSQHDAIDIAVNQGTDITAPADGYVTYILPPSPGGYSYMAVKHAGGYMTVYGHLSEVFVEKYQFVKKGDRIARSGGAVGTPGAGPMTSGPHLHMEVWKNKELIDPLRVMDVTILNYGDLPSRYQDKYIADIVAKSGNTEDADQYARKFTLQGSTEEERQKYLLKTYASPDFQNWKIWSDTALEAGIDPSFLMCVGLAETTLGNHLKTAYNIGNVGNTDSGGTYSFSSAKEGIKWMVATFNNKYLSRYDHVSELSRWGNTDGPIYASSNSNWHNNNIRCLSALKGRWVEDDYVFRIK